MAQECPNPQIDQKNPSDKTKPELLLDEEMGNDGQAKTGNPPVKGIRGGGAQSRSQAGPAAIGQGPADTQNTDWANGRGDGKTDEEAFKEKKKVDRSSPIPSNHGSAGTVFGRPS